MAEDEVHCAMPCSPAQHGSLVRPTSGQFESEAVFTTHACAAASFGRIFILSLLSLSATLSGMSADKLDVFPSNKPLASEVLDWLRVNKPKLSRNRHVISIVASSLCASATSRGT